MKRMKNGKVVDSNDMPVEIWRFLGEGAVGFLTRLFKNNLRK